MALMAGTEQTGVLAHATPKLKLRRLDREAVLNAPWERSRPSGLVNFHSRIKE